MPSICRCAEIITNLCKNEHSLRGDDKSSADGPKLRQPADRLATEYSDWHISCVVHHMLGLSASNRKPRQG